MSALKTTLLSLLATLALAAPAPSADATALSGDFTH